MELDQQVVEQPVDVHFLPVNYPDTQMFLGQAFLKREGYYTDCITGEAWRADIVDDVAKSIWAHSRRKRVTDAMRHTAMQIISMLVLK